MFSALLLIGLIFILYMSLRSKTYDGLSLVDIGKKHQKFVYGYYINSFCSSCVSFISKRSSPPYELNGIQHEGIGIIVYVYEMRDGLYKHVVKIYANQEYIDYLPAICEYISSLYLY